MGLQIRPTKPQSTACNAAQVIICGTKYCANCTSAALLIVLPLFFIELTYFLNKTDRKLNIVKTR